MSALSVSFVRRNRNTIQADFLAVSFPEVKILWKLSQHLSQSSLSLSGHRNMDFLVPVFDFSQSVGHSVTTDRKRAGSGAEIDLLFIKNGRGGACRVARSSACSKFVQYVSISRRITRRTGASRVNRSARFSFPRYSTNK